MARAIDADAVKRRAWDIAEAWKGQGRNYEALLLESVVEQIVDTAPTLTPPDEPLMLAGRLTPKMVTSERMERSTGYPLLLPRLQKSCEKGRGVLP